MYTPTEQQVNEWGQAFEENRLLVIPDKNFEITITFYAKVLKGKIYGDEEGYFDLSFTLSNESPLHKFNEFVKTICKNIAELAVADENDVILISRDEYKANVPDEDCDDIDEDNIDDI